MILDSDLIRGFSSSLLVKNFDGPVPIPRIHIEWWDLCCSDEKYVAIAAPRDHAKSTAITLTYTLAALLFRCNDFALIVSDTEGQAVLFLNELKKELTENEDLIELFQVEKLLKDQETDIIVKMRDGHQFRVMAKGSEQKVRGLKWRGKRPNLIVGDDLENDEIVMNPERREKFSRWVNAALLPCLSLDGKIRIVGTILHIDSYLENRMPKIHARYTVIEPLRITSKKKVGMWKAVKYRAHPGPDDFSEILWPERWSEKKLREIRDDRIANGQADLYNQEYLNYPIDESRAIFRRADFLPMDDKKYLAMVNRQLPANYYIGFDLAVTAKTRSDYAVFVVGAIDDNRVLNIIDVIRERMDSLEIIETIFALQEKYNPQWFAGEKGLIESAILPFLEEQMMQRNSFPELVRIKTLVDKEQRAKPIAGRVRIHGCRFLKSAEWYPSFEAELCEFPRGVKDDQVDAFSNIGQALTQMVTAPTAEEAQEEAEEEEKLLLGVYDDDGRSAITGY